jgi:ribosomal protein S6E (S10)
MGCSTPTSIAALLPAPWLSTLFTGEKLAIAGGSAGTPRAMSHDESQAARTSCLTAYLDFGFGATSAGDQRSVRSAISGNGKQQTGSRN